MQRSSEAWTSDCHVAGALGECGARNEATSAGTVTNLKVERLRIGKPLVGFDGCSAIAEPRT